MLFGAFLRPAGGATLAYPLYIGGQFTALSTTTRLRFGAYDEPGTLSTAWDASVASTTGNGANGNFIINMLNVSSDKTLVVGDFTAIGGQNTNVNRVALLNNDGSADTSFSGNANSFVWSCAPSGTGYILGGGFSQYDSTTRTRLCRINSDGSLDTSFATAGTGPDNTVYAIKERADGKIWIVGRFNNVHGTARNKIALLNADGTLDTSFTPAGTGPNGDVNHLIEVPGSSDIIICGGFTDYNGTTVPRTARITQTGTLVGSFAPTYGTTAQLWRMLPYSPTQFLIVGALQNAAPPARTGATLVNYSDGARPTTTYWPVGTGINGEAFDAALDPDGNLVLAGAFTSLNGTGVGRLVRIDSSGAIDSTFNSGMTTGSGIRCLSFKKVLP